MHRGGGKIKDGNIVLGNLKQLKQSWSDKVNTECGNRHVIHIYYMQFLLRKSILEVNLKVFDVVVVLLFSILKIYS